MQEKKDYGDYSSFSSEQKQVNAEQTGTQSIPTGSAKPPEQDKDRSAIKDRIDGAINDTADKLRNLSQKLESDKEGDSQVAKATQAVSSGLQKGADYLESTSTDKLTEQLGETIRTQPLISLGVAFGVGFVLARLLRR